jgi:ABC-type branched-subunit amino acid transport system permease subunit
MSNTLISRQTGSTPYLVAAVCFGVLAIAPYIFSNYAMNQVRDALMFSLLAIGLDFLWGKTGLLSFGHAAFFGAGAYGVAVVSTRLGLDPTVGPWVGMFAGIAIAVVVSLIVGYFLIYGGVRGPYFTIVTLALAVIADHIVVGWSNVTGGNAGLLGVPPLQFPAFSGWEPLSEIGMFWLIGGVVGAMVLVIWASCRGRIGMVLQATQDNELRARALGHDTSFVLLCVFVISAAIASVGGGLYASTVGFVAPDAIGLVLSTQVIVWVALGGRGTLIGPVLATILVIWLEGEVSSLNTKLWPLIIGALFILTVFVFPDGILPKLRSYFNRISESRKTSRKEVA